MEKSQPQFFNKTFSQAFNRNANMKNNNLFETIQTLKELLQYVILDYKFNRNAESSYVLLHKFDIIKTRSLSKFEVNKMNEKERKALSELMGEYKNSPILEIIKEKGLSKPTSPGLMAKNILSHGTWLANNIIEANTEPVETKEDAVAEAEAEAENNGAKVDKSALTALFEEIKKEFEEHRIENAFEMKGKLLQIINEAKEDEMKEFGNLLLEENAKLMEEIDVWYGEIQKILHELDNDEGYIDDTTSKLYTSSYKTLSEGKAILKMEGPMKIPLFNILALMYEAEGFNHWVPFCSAAKMIKHLHRASHVYWMKYGLPFPLKDRECHCFGYGADRFERNGSILLISRSIDFDSKFMEHYGIQIPKESKLIKMDIEVATEFVPINKHEMIMKQVTTVDPKVENTPPFIMTWISRKIGQHMFETLIKKAQNLKGTMWEQGIQKKPEFYEWLDHKVNAFLDQHELI